MPLWFRRGRGDLPSRPLWLADRPHPGSCLSEVGPLLGRQLVPSIDHQADGAGKHLITPAGPRKQAARLTSIRIAHAHHYAPAESNNRSMPDPAYGYRYQVQRAAAWAALPDGTQCPLCGLPMFKDRGRNPDGRSLHWDHVVPVAEGGSDGLKRFVHARCNESRGGRQGSLITNGRRRGGQAAPGTSTGPRGTYNRW
jgi:hypothetical protein